VPIRRRTGSPFLKSEGELDGFFFITQHPIPVMLQQGSGDIAQITTSLVD
jgi:hypothetical protein